LATINAAFLSFLAVELEATMEANNSKIDIPKVEAATMIIILLENPK